MITQVLLKSHNRKNFSCGVNELDLYLKQFASQDIKRKLAVCYVITTQENEVIAYYTLSSNSVNLADIPSELGRSLPYEEIPVIIIGRLAVHEEYQGNKIGQSLLIDAFKRIVEISSNIGSHAVIVDPFNEQAEHFYSKFGFIALKDSKRMFLPLKTIIELFK